MQLPMLAFDVASHFKAISSDDDCFLKDLVRDIFRKKERINNRPIVISQKIEIRKLSSSEKALRVDKILVF